MKSHFNTFVFILSVVFVSVFFMSATQKLDDSKEPTYTKNWEKVDSLENKGLYRMALAEVHSIFELAAARGHHNQVIKSVLYELKFNSRLEEDDYVLGIDRLEDLIKTAPSPSKEILHSLLAEVYWGYYSANSWQFNNRTTVVDVDLKDIRTWDLTRIAQKVRLHYALSLQNESISQSKLLVEFEEIIAQRVEENSIRPTLYDFLGHRALDFFKTASFAIPGPAETFVLDDERYFYSNSSFLKMNAATKDSMNTRFLAAQVFYALTEFNVRSKKVKPAFHLEMERLEYALSKSTLPNKQEYYINGLERMAEAYKQHDFASEAWYKIALYHSALGDGYNPVGDTTKKWEKRKALRICENTIKNYPNAFGSQECEALISVIEQKDLSVNGEEIIVPNQASKFLLNYKNIDQVHVKLVKFDYSKINSIKYRGEKLVKMLRKANGIYSAQSNLTDPKDYNKHSIELPIPKLESGFYFLVVSSEASFDETESGFTYLPIHVNSITYQHRKLGNYNHVLVSNRLTGEPLVNASVKVSYYVYNYNLRRNVPKTLGTFATNQNGMVKFKENAESRSYELTIKYKGEIASPHNGLYSGYNYKDKDDLTHVRLFTDRKMYRPGQTIYFKGIAIKHNGKERELQKNLSTTVSFYDANGQIVKTKSFKTNQFGSFEGEFVAPFGVLTGQMTLSSNYNGTTLFRVEEYKRPKFNVTMQPITGEFQLNDSIHAKGIAEAFAGNKIDGAAVKYRVVRSVRYNYWGYWWGWRPIAEPKEIANGTLMTDENGEFDVAFMALPDKESDPKTLPIFVYTIYADVTDINGETHTTSSAVQVGYQSVVLGNNLGAAMNNAEPYYLRLNTTNLNGQKIGAEGKIVIEKLIVPNQPYYSRLWGQPDMNNWAESEFKEKFPTENYGSEHMKESWETEEVAFETTFNTTTTDSIGIDSYKDWKPGVYKYTSTAMDKKGIEVKDVVYFTVFNPNKLEAPNNEVLWLKQMENSDEPGEKVTILLASMETDLLVNYDIEANGVIIKTDKLKLTKEQTKVEFEVKEEHRGNITFHFTALKNNKHFSESIIVVVPYTNKQLDLSFSTFRNKLVPGQAEEWIMTIKNKLGEGEKAELLATLYDASLDQLYTPNSFYMNVYKTFYGNQRWGSPRGLGITQASNINYHWNSHVSYPYRYFQTLKYFGWSSYYYGTRFYYDAMSYGDADSMVLESVAIQKSSNGRRNKDAEKKERSENEAVMDMEEPAVAGNMDITEQDNRSDGKKEETDSPNLDNISARANFNETAFFYPQLLTNANGDVEIKFTIPESLTKWRFLGLAHTKDLKVGTISEEVVTQKELMVVPNAPRFLREGDQITIATKISNISEEDLSGSAKLVLYNPFTEEEIDAEFGLSNTQLNFDVEKGRSTTVSWNLKVPYTQSAVKYKIVAQAGSFSDGEENVLPILSNRMMVTESLPLPIRGNQERTFKFEKLVNANKSKTLKHHRYTLEFTSNPAWYAIQAMPYMMEYPHECAEQTFTRYYSNAIASHIMNSNPKIKKIIDAWGEDSPDAFLSNLQKNQELKAVILEETPWVLDAKNEEASKRNLAVLLDMDRMSRELDKALGKTVKTQSSNGGWPWFPGMPESRYITQHIVTGMGHLDHLGIKDIREDQKVWRMIVKAVHYLDGEIVKDFQNAKKWDKNYLENQHIGYNQIQYMYARSYFPKIGMNGSTQKAVDYYKDQAKKFWLKFNIYAEGMIALAADRFDLKDLSGDIVKSLKDRSIQHDEFGMYWKDYHVGYYWYEAPVETQALMIEMFDEVADDQESVEELKIWLLKQKQTTNWKTTKQTTEAVYALLLKGTDLLASDDLVEITLGGKPIEYTQNPDAANPYQVKPQAGTGYFKTAWDAEEVKAELGDITVKKPNDGVAWGAAYWQYFEDLDKITFAETNLKLQKDLYLVKITNRGEQLTAITEDNVLQVGDKVRVRIELRTDRNMEYVHMKDMRASGFEPVDVLSRYKYQDGLGYYQSTKDAATHFFFDYVQKGTYVFEYDLRVQHKGDFSNGITTIQCMYAPEFTSHSDGIRVTVE